MFLLLFIVFAVLFYFYSTRNHNYWAKRNIKHDNPVPLFGNHLPSLLAMKSITEISVDCYKKFPGEKVVGYYRGNTPELIIKDPDIIRKIMTVDFLHFYKRGLGRNPELEPRFGNLFHAEGDRWRLLRQRLTPAFTTAKLRAMFPLVIRCAERLQDLVTQLAGRGASCDARELMAKFTTEFIGACGFGIEMDTINEDRSQFRELGELIFNISLRNRFLLPIWELFPAVRSFLKVENDDMMTELTSMVKNIRDQRNNKPVGRNDFIDLLLELETKGKITGESIEKVKPDGSPIMVDMEMDLECQVAQVSIFFAAGFETSSSATSFTLHVLSFNPEIQKKVQEEIDAVMLKYNNKLCYEAIADMKYLEMAFKEGMRMFPSVGILNRVCTQKYNIEELGITIDPGVKIIIPVQAIQMDERFFDNPQEFRPERFTPEAEKERHHFTYLPFGEGPRGCIGTRLGHMQSLAGLAAVLHRFTVEPAKTTVARLRLKPKPLVTQSVVGGLPLIFKPRRTPWAKL